MIPFMIRKRSERWPRKSAHQPARHTHFCGVHGYRSGGDGNL